MPTKKPHWDPEKDRLAHQTRYYRRKEQGLCVKCADPAAEGFTECERCRLRKQGTAVAKKPGRPRTLSATNASFYPTPEQLAWLRRHPDGISAVIRRLVEEAMQKERQP